MQRTMVTPTTCGCKTGRRRASGAWSATRGVLLRTRRAAGYTMPAETALAHLEGIAEVAHVYPDSQALLTTNTVTPVQRTRYEPFQLERWIAPL